MEINRAQKYAEKVVDDHREDVEKIAEKNFLRGLSGFREEKIGSQHFAATSGYGYDDLGRDSLEALYAKVFATEAALVRQQMISGTQAIYLALAGNLLPGDELLTVGMPYDTLLNVIGVKEIRPGTLREAGIFFRSVEVDFDAIDLDKVVAAIGPKTKILSIQRSRGYSWRRTLSVSDIGNIIKAVKSSHPEVIVFVDNCYGEMVEEIEPSHLGADLMAGSLIKNMGAGLAPGGGYLVGREDLIERASYKLTVPGAGREVGSSLVSNRLFYQSLFMAPQIVKEAVLGAIFSAAFLEYLGFEISPVVGETRHDIIQAVKLGDSERLIAFCQGIQRYSPIDSFALPIPAPMPGYDNDVIMAAGTFTQGSTIELSADAPLREPYIAYIQGGLNYYHVKYAVVETVKDMLKKGLI